MAARVVSSIQNWDIHLRQEGGFIRSAVSDQLEIEARRIADIARKMVPREEGNMEGAIVLGAENNRRRWIIWVDETQADDTGRYTVGDYLNFLHEGSYDLGPASKAKQQGNPYTVGPKFMERAYMESAFRANASQGLLSRLAAAVKRLGIFS